MGDVPATHGEVSGRQEMELPGVKHNVIGLVSGGKDSTFNLLHCVANGHELVALATLTPEAGIGESTTAQDSSSSSFGATFSPVHVPTAVATPVFSIPDHVQKLSLDMYKSAELIRQTN